MAIQLTTSDGFFGAAALIHPSFVDNKDAENAQAPILALPSQNEPDMVRSCFCLPLFILIARTHCHTELVSLYRPSTWRFCPRNLSVLSASTTASMVRFELRAAKKMLIIACRHAPRFRCRPR